MLDIDTLLQEKLNALESGQSLDEILDSLPAEAVELEPLLKLAAAVRATPHPEPVSAQLTTQRDRVMAAAYAHTRPIAPPDNLAQKPFQRNSLPWLKAGAVFGALAAMILCVAMAVITWPLLSGTTQTARIENITGQVQVAVDSSGKNWKNVSIGQRLHSGQRLRTLGASRVVLVFFEGSRTYLGPNSDIMLTQLDGSGESLRVDMQQNSGATNHQVIPLKGKNSYFLVHTPSGTASVHGTRFNVKVNDNGHAQIAVERGEVLVTNASSQVTLLPGQATDAEPGLPPADPAYQFTIQGSLIVMQVSTWQVSGVSFDINESTSITGDPQLGQTIQVSGRVLANGSRIADTVEAASNSDQSAFITGPIQSMTASSWQVGDNSINIDTRTAVAEGLSVGEIVKVTFNVLGSGEWLALNISSLKDLPEEPTAVLTATSVPGAMPSLSFEPDEIEISGCKQSSFNVSGALKNTGSAAKDFAANVQLGYIILNGGEYVESVDLDPAQWTRIDAGQTVQYLASIGLNDDFQNADVGTEVKLRFYVAQETNRPGHHTSRVTVTIRAGCDQDPTATPPSATPTEPATATQTYTPTRTGETSTPAPDATATPEASPTPITPPTPVPPEAGQCTGAELHPTGMTLAQRYGVPYEEIMYWFCQNFGFGEIDLAYSLSRQANIPVDQVFQMRAAGKGWGEVKQEIAPDDQDKDGQGNDKDNGKDKDKDKDKKNPKDKKP